MKRLLAAVPLVAFLATSGYCQNNALTPEPGPIVDWAAAAAAQTRKGQDGENEPEAETENEGGPTSRAPNGRTSSEAEIRKRIAARIEKAKADEAERTEGNEERGQEKPALEYDRSLYQPALVLIEGSKGVGTAFICKVQGIPFIVTNIHVLGGADASRSYGNGFDTLSIRTVSGKRLTPLSIFGAVGHDLCIIRFAEADEFANVALDFETDVAHTTHAKDDIVIPGNSKGGGVMVWTEGEVVGIGPDRIEHNAPVYSGNSGSPIIHLKNQKVVGVLSYAEQVAIHNFVDKKSFNDRRSAIQGKVRYFGYRLDSPSEWYQIELPRFIRQNDEMNNFIERRKCVATFLYTDDEDWRADRELSAMMNDLEDLIRSRSTGNRVTRETILQANIALTRRLEVLIKDDSYRNYMRYLHENKNRHGGSQAYYPYFLDKIEREVKIREHLAHNIQEWETRVRRYMR